jgi:high-affinity nickel permease
MSAAVASGDSISTFPISKSVNLPFLYAHGTMIIQTTDAFVASTTKARGSITTYSIISRPTP